MCSNLHFLFHNITYLTAVTAYSGFYFEKKTHAELSRQPRQCARIFDEETELVEVTTC